METPRRQFIRHRRRTTPRYVVPETEPEEKNVATVLSHTTTTPYQSDAPINGHEASQDTKSRVGTGYRLPLSLGQSLESVVPARWHASQQFFHVVNCVFATRYFLAQCIIFAFCLLCVLVGSSTWYQPLVFLWQVAWKVGKGVIFLLPLPKFLEFEERGYGGPLEATTATTTTNEGSFFNQTANGTTRDGATLDRASLEGTGGVRLFSSAKSIIIAYGSLVIGLGILVSLRAILRLRMYSTVNKSSYGPLVSTFRAMFSPTKVMAVVTEIFLALFIVSRIYALSSSNEASLLRYCRQQPDDEYITYGSYGQSGSFGRDALAKIESFLTGSVATVLRFLIGGTTQSFLSKKPVARGHAFCVNDRLLVVYVVAIIFATIVGFLLFCSPRESLYSWRERLFSIVFPDSRIQQRMIDNVQLQTSEVDVKLKYPCRANGDLDATSRNHSETEGTIVAPRYNKRLKVVPEHAGTAPYIVSICVGWLGNSPLWKSLEPLVPAIFDRALFILRLGLLLLLVSPLLASLSSWLIAFIANSVFSFTKIEAPHLSYLHWLGRCFWYFPDVLVVIFYTGCVFIFTEICTHLLLPRGISCEDIILQRDPRVSLKGLNLSGEVRTEEMKAGKLDESISTPDKADREENSVDNPFASLLDPSNVDNNFGNSDMALKQYLKDKYLKHAYSLERLGLHEGQVDVYSLRFPGIASAPRKTLCQFMLHWAANGRGIAVFRSGISDGTEILTGSVSNVHCGYHPPMATGDTNEELASQNSNYGCRRNLEKIYSNVTKSWSLYEHSTISGINGAKGATTAVNMVRLWQSRMADGETALYSSLVDAFPSDDASAHQSPVLSSLLAMLNATGSDSNLTPRHLWRDLGRNAMMSDMEYGVVYSTKDRNEIWQDSSGNRWRALIWSLTGTLDSTSICLVNSGYTQSLPSASRVMSSQTIRGCSKFIPLRLRRYAIDISPFDPIRDAARRLPGGFAAADFRAKAKEREESSFDGEQSRFVRFLQAWGCLHSRRSSRHDSLPIIAKFLWICGYGDVLALLQNRGYLLPGTSYLERFFEKCLCLRNIDEDAPLLVRVLERCGCLRTRRRSKQLIKLPSSDDTQNRTDNDRRAADRQINSPSSHSMYSLPKSKHTQGFNGPIRYEQRGQLVNPANEAISTLVNRSSNGVLPWIIRNSLRSVSLRTDMLLWDAANVRSTAKSLTSLLMAALEEDEHGLVKQTIGFCLCSLLTLHDSLIVYANTCIDDANSEIQSCIFGKYSEDYAHISESDRWLFVHDDLVATLKTVRSCLIVLLCEYYNHLTTENERLLKQLDLDDIRTAAEHIAERTYRQMIRNPESRSRSRLGKVGLHPIIPCSVIPLPVHHEDSLQRIWEDICEGNPFGSFLLVMTYDTILVGNANVEEERITEGSGGHKLTRHLAEDLPLPSLIERLEPSARIVLGHSKTNSLVFKAWDLKRRYARAKRLLFY